MTYGQSWTGAIPRARQFPDPTACTVGEKWLVYKLMDGLCSLFYEVLVSCLKVSGPLHKGWHAAGNIACNAVENKSLAHKR